MYLGRIVAIGMNNEGKLTGMYRVSSRSFPNREAKINNRVVSVMPRKGFEKDLTKNPYIAYNCIRYTDKIAVITNGSHTDPIFEKICDGMNPRDALTLSLLLMDYEKDSYNTPRISGILSKDTRTGFLGIVRKDALLVREFGLSQGKLYYLATYEKDTPTHHYYDENFNAKNASEASEYIISGGVFENFEHPVTSAAIMETPDSYDIAVKTV